MILRNEQVRHKSFGEGRVVEYTESYIEVRFPDGDKKFAFPDALGTFLTLVDKKVAKRFESLKRKIEEKRKDEELELERQRVVVYEEQQLLLERERLMKNHRLHPVSQVAFWCDEEELDLVFSEWRLFTGLMQSGSNKGQPSRLIRLHQNSAALITARAANEPEQNRRILGVFMVDEGFNGRLCEDGYIPAHPQHRLTLSEEESKKVLFWNYYFNERYPRNMTWNSGRSRYFHNVWLAQILQETVALRRDSVEREIAQAFLDYFCRMNQLVTTDLPKPNGALRRLVS